MNKSKKGLLIVVALAVTLGMTATLWAADGSPGSEEDPLVSKSYVDARTSFAPIQLLEGQRLIGGEGAEIIPRSGEVTAIDNGEDGVSNLTAGTDLMTGEMVALNHHLLIPRDDGRGVAAITDSWVMVRGSYTIH